METAQRYSTPSLVIPFDAILAWRRYTLVFLAATLCCTVTLKIAGIQYLEWIFAADFLVLTALCAGEGLRLRVFGPYLEIAKSYAIFLVLAFILSLFALQQGFSYSFNEGILKTPVILTLSRMAEMFLDAFYMLYLATLYRDDPKLCAFGARTYFWTGIAGCIYSAATLPLNVLYDLQLGTYADHHRFRGFNNEGGGFGLYLISVGILAVPMYQRKWLSKAQFQWGMAIITLSLFASQSKSALFGLAMFGTIVFLWLLRGWKKWILIGGLAAGLVVMGSIINLPRQIDQYVIGAQQYQEYSNLKWGDPSYVMGRVSGLVIAPRMIAARPLLGIGWGNYPLVRDNPEYRRGTAFSLGLTDAPSLGIIDYIVELGFPLWAYLTWIQLKPVIMLRRRHADLWLVSLALVLPVSTWAGAHLNLMHSWVVGAFGLGLGYAVLPATTHAPETSAPVSLP